MTTPLPCPLCGSTQWSRFEERTVQDQAWIETSLSSLFEFADEETIETKALTPWECPNDHPAPDAINAELEAIR